MHLKTDKLDYLFFIFLASKQLPAALGSGIVTCLVFCCSFSQCGELLAYCPIINILKLPHKVVCIIILPLWLEFVIVPAISWPHCWYLTQFYIQLLYTANDCRDLQGLCEEIGVREFQIYRDCMYTRNPCNSEISTLWFQSKNCRDFDFTGILWGFPALDVGKSCNRLIFLDISVKFAGIFCKL